MGTVDDSKAGSIPAQVAYGSTANTAAEGNDARIAGAAQTGTNGVIVLTPSTGDTVEIAPDSYNTKVFINASGTLAALTLHFHDGIAEGQEIVLLAQHSVTTPTYTGNFDSAWNPTSLFIFGPYVVGVLAWHAGKWYAYRLAF